MEPDYKQCTLAELYDVEENINKQRYPQRYNALMQEIERTESKTLTPNLSQNLLMTMKRARLNG